MTMLSFKRNINICEILTVKRVLRLIEFSLWKMVIHYIAILNYLNVFRFGHNSKINSAIVYRRHLNTVKTVVKCYKQIEKEKKSGCFNCSSDFYTP